MKGKKYFLHLLFTLLTAVRVMTTSSSPLRWMITITDMTTATLPILMELTKQFVDWPQILDDLYGDLELLMIIKRSHASTTASPGRSRIVSILSHGGGESAP